jgi:2-polyprenyl-6-methoxyphenol hydroxylase-like FAD-dependent oxidoreductase
MDPRIIVLGGGPVGLGAALELARFGVRSVLVERHDATSWHPKTRNFNTRTMEIARGWGNPVYKRLRSIDTPPGWKSPIRFLASATGREFGTIESLGFEGPGPEVSPALPVMSSQDLIEEILLDSVRASGAVDIRFGTEATRLVAGGARDDREVVLELRDRESGVVEQLCAPALVAADGADSMIRAASGLQLQGAKNLYHVVNCYFLADIERHLGERRGVLLFVSNPRAAGVLQPLDGAGRWLCQITVAPEEWSLEVFTKDRAREWVRAASGIDDLDVDVRSLGLWKLNATVIERMVQGRVVICGDAAHQFPPTGGLGVNTGLQGMHNAMWKLALFAQGKAGWPLVETYDTERRAVSQSIVNQSLQNSINVARINAAAVAGGDSGLSTAEVLTASRRYGNHLGVEFGARYASLAVIPDGTTPPDVEDSYSDYVQTATPGCRAPHLWLGRADAELSTLDLIGTRFTLLAAPRGTAWRDVAREAERSLGVGVDCYVIDGAGLQDRGRFAEVYGVGAEGAVLLRPDGYVAWRCVGAPAGKDALVVVLEQVLARSSSG